MIAIVAAAIGALLTWEEYSLRKDFQDARLSPDGPSSLSTAHYDSGWPRPVCIILSLGIFTFSLQQFISLNAAVPIPRRKLKILTRPEW